MLTPVVFLPGLLCDSEIWSNQINFLADRIAPFVANLSLDSTIQEMAERTLAAAAPRFALAAISMGGYVAFEILRQAPQRVTRLALFSTSAAPDSESRRKERHLAISSLQVGQFKGVTNRMLPSLIHPSLTNGNIGKTVQSMAARVGKGAYLRQQNAILNRVDSRGDLAAINLPTIVSAGECDMLIPHQASKEIASGITGAELHIFANCGHLPPIEKPIETSRLLQSWLADNSEAN